MQAGIMASKGGFKGLPSDSIFLLLLCLVATFGILQLTTSMKDARSLDYRFKERNEGFLN
jgi:hypothetical protein